MVDWSLNRAQYSLQDEPTSESQSFSRHLCSGQKESARTSFNGNAEQVSKSLWFLPWNLDCTNAVPSVSPILLKYCRRQSQNLHCKTIGWKSRKRNILNSFHRWYFKWQKVCYSTISQKPIIIGWTQIWFTYICYVGRKWAITTLYLRWRVSQIGD